MKTAAIYTLPAATLMEMAFTGSKGIFMIVELHILLFLVNYSKVISVVEDR